MASGMMPSADHEGPASNSWVTALGDWGQGPACSTVENQREGVEDHAYVAAFAYGKTKPR